MKTVAERDRCRRDASWLFSRSVMVAVAPPQNGKWNFTVGALGVNRGEAGPTQLPDGVDVQYPFESHPTEDHSTVLTLDAAYYIDRFKVTNQNYSDFLKASGWRPVVASWVLALGPSACVATLLWLRTLAALMGRENRSRK